MDDSSSARVPAARANRSESPIPTGQLFSRIAVATSCIIANSTPAFFSVSAQTMLRSSPSRKRS